MKSRGFRFLLCDCEGTNPIDDAVLASALGSPLGPTCTELCQGQAERLRAGLAEGNPLLVGCTQEAPLFLELSREAGFAGELRFVNVREKAGWSRDHAAAAPKMAALLAEATLDTGGPGTVSLHSDGHVLVVGEDDVALDAARRLGRRMEVTLLLAAPGPGPRPGGAVSAPRVAEIPILSGVLAGARGHLGAFELSVEHLALRRPSAKASLTFRDAAGAEILRGDIVLDLRRREPLFPAPGKRDGYFHPDPRDPGAVAQALFEITDLVGDFDKPRYVRYDAGLCAHKRSGIVGCTRCLDSCPTGAITSAAENVEIDPYVCAGCGSCASVCPSGAASYTLPESPVVIQRLRTLLATYRSAGGKRPALLIHDQTHGEDMIDAMARHYDGLPANVIPVAVNAVTQCSLEVFLAARTLGASGVTVLAATRAREELAPLEETATLCNALLAGLGYPDGTVSITVEDDPEALCRALWERARNASDPAPLPAFEPLGLKRDLMRLSLSALHRGAPSPVDTLPLPAGAPFGTVDIDTEGCTLCFACVGACPPGALRTDPDHPRLSFVESACVQCGICVKTCPEKVIGLVPRLDFTAAARQPRTIKEDRPFECVRCGKPFGATSTIEGVVERMRGHAMFSDPQALERLRMCADCRVVDIAESGSDPFAGAARPKPRTTDDYLRARERGERDDDDLLH